MLLTIGELVERAGVPTSTVRYYERRGLVLPDAHRSGQRRYRTRTLRRLVFIGMCQDTGMTLEDIEGVLGAEDLEGWKAIARQRLVALDRQIADLHRARTYLEGALFCPYDHPLTDCSIMGAEIDRRLGGTGTGWPSPPARVRTRRPRVDPPTTEAFPP